MKLVVAFALILPAAALCAYAERPPVRGDVSRHLVDAAFVDADFAERHRNADRSEEVVRGLNSLFRDLARLICRAPFHFIVDFLPLLRS